MRLRRKRITETRYQGGTARPFYSVFENLKRVRLEQHSDRALILQMVEGGLYRCSQLKYVSEKNEEKLATIRQLATTRDMAC
jgi:hypothetical protein